VEQLRQEVAQAHYMETQTQHLLHQARANQTQVRHPSRLVRLILFGLVRFRLPCGV
jgi:hypothetical protein